MSTYSSLINCSATHSESQYMINLLKKETVPEVSPQILKKCSNKSGWQEHSWLFVILIVTTTNQTTAMNVDQIISQFVTSVSQGGHQTRTQSLTACVQSAMSGNALTVTSMGRGIQSKAHQKHNIKRADRLCSNPHLWAQIPLIYQRICTLIVSKNSRPTIHVDWSDLNLSKTLFLIRASISFQGRALTLYEEVHPLETKEKPATHDLFLKTLKLLLPKNTCPIIVTDAGFKRPWFKSVQALGWDFVGRIRGRICLSPDGKTMQLCKTLYPCATSSARGLKNWFMGGTSPYPLQLVLYKERPKGRIAKTAGGKRKQSNYSKKNARRAREPWLLAASLNLSKKSPAQIVQIYHQRMQIEEAFRDHKSSQFGMGMEQHRTKSHSRLSVIVLIGTLAHNILILFGIMMEEQGLHRHYQANTVKDRRVLSHVTLGLHFYRHGNADLSLDDWHLAILILREKVTESQVIRE